MNKHGQHGTFDLASEYKQPAVVSEQSSVDGVYITLMVDMPAPVRPDEGVVYLILWAKAGILIPWPRGMTYQDAIFAWADQERERPLAEGGPDADQGS